MLNNVVLDVAIGLVFIYLLYSLLATTIKELFATLFAYRGKMLERGIEQMLDGKNYKYRWWNKVSRWFVSKDASGNRQSKILSLKENLFANKIISHDLYKRLAEKSNTDKPSYLAADSFSDILIDVLKNGKEGTVLLRDISAYVDGLNNNAGLQKILRLYIEQANGDLQKFKLLVENWYNDMMDRVSGWYKQQAYRILIYIGLVLAVVFNISTIEIVERLSKDKNAREAMLQSATKYVNDHVGSVKEPIKKQVAPDTTTTAKKKPASSPAENKIDSMNVDSIKNKNNDVKKEVAIVKPDSVVTIDSGFTAIRSKIDSIKLLYQSTIADNNDIVGLGWGDYGFTADSLQWVSDVKAGKKSCEPAHKHAIEKVAYILWESARTPRKWLGFLITALAISLGAPFWFDLLNKFINLRVSGAKPTDTTSAPVSKTALLNQKPDPAAKG